ncbi:transmembrane protein, putative (macronuclear) [Tetrahymena thermophila SB210]|uniref:Transmembrane protein, putative n=1 Tax=Tetrahymena thermophila (strain SB210) TaxID=312017 RepID=Q23B19_TETTS|nr:transmembrane protein, putative [Tetrahymena thermophila SB210]EAR93665.1 transmembrane protein, putative [Tetrahymena thermophila SB210]|eukprot:XP_001013910.1 transmembrane protein, putative [Tetrahymena thermophila SB210]
MNKLILILPILSLIGIQLFFILNQKNNLQNLVPVTFDQFQECTDEIPDISELPCAATESFRNATEKFFNATTPDYPNVPQACSDYYNYTQQEISIEDFINQNNYFLNCFITENVREIANSEECFFKHFYAPTYLLCGGFNIYAYPPYTKYDIKN